MRGIELVLGTMLLASGVVGPLIPDDALGPVNHRTTGGSLTFHDFQFQGNATIFAHDAAMRAEGALQTEVRASSLVLTVYDFTFASTVPPDPLRFGELTLGVADSEVRTYRNSTITFDMTEKGVVQLWPGSDGAGNLFRVHASAPDGPTTIGASPSSARLGAPGHDELEYLVPPPVVAISNMEARMDKGNLVHVNSSYAGIHGLDARGDMVFTMADGQLGIEHDDGYDKFTLGGSEVAPPEAGGTRAGRATLAVLHTSDTEARISLTDAAAVVLTRNPLWAINGTVEVASTNGTLRSSIAPAKAFDDALVTANGILTLALAPEGALAPYGTVGPVTINGVGAVSDDTVVRGHLETSDAQVSLNGSPYPPLAETPVSSAIEVGFLARVLGLAVLAWAASKHAALYVRGLVSKAPFKSQRRRQLYDEIRAQGMAHVRGLHRTTGIPLGSLVYHLNILERGTEVRSVRCAGYRVYFTRTGDFSRDEIEALALLADSGRRSISTALASQGQASQGSLQCTTGLSRTTVSKHVRVLERAGLLERLGRRNIQYRPTELLNRWLRFESSVGPVAASKVPAAGTPEARPDPPPRTQPPHASCGVNGTPPAS